LGVGEAVTLVWSRVHAPHCIRSRGDYCGLIDQRAKGAHNDFGRVPTRAIGLASPLNQKRTMLEPLEFPGGATPVALKYAIVTPSYAPDFEHCRLLVESVQRFVPESVHHYILVDRCDEALFSQLRSNRTHLVIKQDLLPWWLIQFPMARKWWVNFRGPPVRGWILQQLTKLSVNLAVPADVYIFLDSGAFFVSPYDPSELLQGTAVPLLREQKAELASVPWNVRWHQVAAKLLGLPVQNTYDTGYIGNLVFWRRENLTKLQQHVQAHTGRHWLASVTRQLRFSEYVLYGMFAEHVLKDQSNQYFYSIDRSLNHWSEEHLTEEGLREFKRKLEPHVAVVMINEKARIPLSTIRRVFVE
jgi:hypothetical protein